MNYYIIIIMLLLSIKEGINMEIFFFKKTIYIHRNDILYLFIYCH